MFIHRHVSSPKNTLRILMQISDLILVYIGPVGITPTSYEVQIELHI
jgi:hypothetical protein